MIPLFQVTTSGPLVDTTLQPGDMIHVIRDKGTITIKIRRNDILLFLGREQLALLMTGSEPETTAPQAWAIIDLILSANWVVTTVLDFSDDAVSAEIRRIATCREEADPSLPSCDAGGDGFGRD